MLTPRESPNSALPLHTEAVQEVFLGLPSLHVTTKGSWLHLGVDL